MNGIGINNCSVDKEEKNRKPYTLSLSMDLIRSPILICNIYTTYIVVIVIDSSGNLKLFDNLITKGARAIAAFADVGDSRFRLVVVNISGE